MRTLSTSFACTLVVACAVSDQRVIHPIATPGRNVPVFSTTEPAPHGSELRVFQDPDKLVGWIAGSESFAGQPVQFDGHLIGVVVGDDNTFTIPIGFSHRAFVEADIAGGTLCVLSEETFQPEESYKFICPRESIETNPPLQRFRDWLLREVTSIR